MTILAFFAGLAVGILATAVYAYGIRLRMKHLSDKSEKKDKER